MSLRATPELVKYLRPARFPGMSPKMASIVNYILGEPPTARPAITGLVITSDGHLLAQMEGDIGANAHIGIAIDLYQNWERLIMCANMPDKLRIEAGALFDANIQRF